MPSLKDRFLTADTFLTFLESATENRDIWHSIWTRARVPAEHIARLEAVPGRWHLLVLCTDWCGDGANTVPVIARLAATARNLDVRLLDRDENPDLRDAHLTNGAQSIPVVMILDEDYVEQTWWGPRPAPIQQWVRDEGMKLPPEERYRRVRAWYARDRGLTTIEEIVAMIEALGRRESVQNGESHSADLSIGSGDARDVDAVRMTA